MQWYHSDEKKAGYAGRGYERQVKKLSKCRGCQSDRRLHEQLKLSDMMAAEKNAKVK